ncbi:MAG: hypothetical protein HUK09_02645 [Bacteroidaceae bacterium]|nr:hypothetical protein [Bacteroidaceae bacterium]
MALQTEIWVSSIIEGLFADNSFLSHSVNFDQFVNNKKVHVPNAGAGSDVQKNRSVFPASVQKRVDTDLEFTLDEYSIDPTHIPNAETVELSYDKRNSIISTNRAKLFDAIAVGMLKAWAPSKPNRIFSTSGKAEVAHTIDATGNRKSLTKEDVMKVMTQFNKDNVPATDRWLLIDAVMYSQLLNSLTENESRAFFSCADPARGVIGQLYGFNVMQRSEVLCYEGTTPKEANTNGKATDFAAALAWHGNSVLKSAISRHGIAQTRVWLCPWLIEIVGRALGKVKMFDEQDSPTYYGDIVSFSIRCGGAIIRADQKGVAAIVQSASA